MAWKDERRNFFALDHAELQVTPVGRARYGFPVVHRSGLSTPTSRSPLLFRAATTNHPLQDGPLMRKASKAKTPTRRWDASGLARGFLTDCPAARNGNENRQP